MGVASEDSEGISVDVLVADTSTNSIKIFMSRNFDVDDIDDTLADNEFMDADNPSFSYGSKADKYALTTELRYPDIWLSGIFDVTPGKHTLYINHNGVTEDGMVNLSIEIR